MIIVLEIILSYIIVKNKKLVFRVFSQIFSEKIRDYSIVPEYERYMTKVVMSLSVADKTLEPQHSLLMSLPEYTQVMLLLPKNKMPAIKEELKRQPYGGRIKLISFDIRHEKQTRIYLFFSEKDKIVYGDVGEGMTIPYGTVWAQDLFEVAIKPDGKKFLLISDIHKSFTSSGNQADVSLEQDNSYIKSLSSKNMHIHRSMLAFDGGNILIDEIDGKRIAFCGGDILRNTRTVWAATRDSKPTDSEIIYMLKKDLDADKVVIIGRERVQPTSLMFHLDQAMVLLPNRVAGVANIVGPTPGSREAAEEVKEVKFFLSTLRSVLLQLGYRIIDIDTSIYNILNHQHYVNGITYIDVKTNERTMLMPVFSAGSLEKTLERKNIATFESLGYRVIPVHSCYVPE